MIFNSIHYLVFFPVVALLFFLLSVGFRAVWPILRAAVTTPGGHTGLSSIGLPTSSR